MTFGKNTHSPSRVLRTSFSGSPTAASICLQPMVLSCCTALLALLEFLVTSYTGVKVELFSSWASLRAYLGVTKSGTGAGLLGVAAALGCRSLGYGLFLPVNYQFLQLGLHVCNSMRQNLYSFFLASIFWQHFHQYIHSSQALLQCYLNYLSFQFFHVFWDHLWMKYQNLR